MIQKFSKHLDRLIGPEKNINILIAVSGGADSIVLSHLLSQTGYNLIMAHCNFGLRGNESDEDELFVRKFSNDLHIPLHVKHFETAQYAFSNAVSIQMAARELRYTWFQELAQEQTCAYIAVAHHQDDQIETFFINLFRGSGIRGFRGMLSKNGNIIRPLLFAQRPEIEIYASENQLIYRTDSSNARNKYERNAIRNSLLPYVYRLFGDAKTGIMQSLNFLSENEKLYNELVAITLRNIVHANGQIVTIDKVKLLEIQSFNTILFECISVYGFNGNQISAIALAWKSKPGKIFYSASHRLSINRDIVEIEPLAMLPNDTQYIVDEHVDEISFPVSLKFSFVANDSSFKMAKRSEMAYFDSDQLQFPLHIRKWKEADRFVPFGLDGSKLISDFFIDRHFTLHQKESCWLLCNKDDTILWLIGIRASDKNKITNLSQRILVVQLGV